MKRSITHQEHLCDICNRDISKSPYMEIKKAILHETTGSMGQFESFIKPQKIEICSYCMREFKNASLKAQEPTQGEE